VPGPSIDRVLPSPHRPTPATSKKLPVHLRAVRRPFFSCVGSINLFLHSYAREYIGDDTAALERSKSDKNKVRIMFFSFWMHGNTQRPHQSIANRCLIPIKGPQTTPASSQYPKASPDVPILPIHPPWPSRKPPASVTTKKFARSPPKPSAARSRPVMVTRTSKRIPTAANRP
jgi:hypothetical protein